MPLGSDLLLGPSVIASVSAGLLLLPGGLIHLTLVPYAYWRLGFDARNALLLTLLSFIGSHIDVPLARFPDHYVATQHEIVLFGMHRLAQGLAELPGTIVAINIGGAIIPIAVSLYLIQKNNLWRTGLMTTACVAAVSYWLAYPVAGAGIALPLLIPVVVTAVMAVLISRDDATSLAYIGGSLGTLLGADILNLESLQHSTTPAASIGGAGTFDGVFLTGLIALLVVDIALRRPTRPSHNHSWSNKATHGQ